MKKNFIPMAVVVRLQEIKKSVYDNKRDLALSQIDDMIKQITEHDTHCERCGSYLSEVDYHCGGELCEPCFNTTNDRLEKEREEIYKKILAFNGAKLDELDDNHRIFLNHAIDVSRKFNLFISIGDDEVVNIKPFTNDTFLPMKIQSDLKTKHKLNGFR